jgi:hypothetical protein
MTKQINGDKLFVIAHHPAIPSSDQLKKWEDQWFNEEEHADVLLIQAFQAGADQELEACCDWIREQGYHPSVPRDLHADRRPKPPSLKEQALMALERQSTRSIPSTASFQDCEIIRQALEQLDD